jgi:hypothetical protein
VTTDIIPIYLRVPRHEIVYVKFIFESYEEVGICRTLDRHAAILVLLAVPDFVSQAHAIVAALQAEGVCEAIAPPPGLDGDVLGPGADD